MPSKKFFDIRPPKRIQKLKFEDIPPKRKAFPLSKTFPLPKALPLPKTFPFPKKILALVLSLFCISVIFLHLGARAEIEIWPKAESFSAQSDLLVDEKISKADFSKEIIPGFSFSKEKTISQEFSATGILGKEGRASGQIRVYNNYHLPQTLVATTRFISADGKLFRSKEAVNIPASQYLDVEVEAAELGPEYNIKPSTFSIPGLLGSPRYTAVYGKSFSLMEGGYVGEASQVTKNDLEKAKDNLYEKLIGILKKELKDVAGPSFLFLEEAIKNEVLESSCSKQAGEEAKKFECHLKLKSEALAFKETDLEDFAKQFILQETQENKNIKEDTLKIEPSVKEVDFEAEKIFLELKISAMIFSAIDTGLMKEALRGKSLKESEVLLSTYPEIEKTEIRASPFWIQTIPQDIEKIKTRLILEEID